MRRKTKAVIFDLDGTLLDTLGDLYTCVNHTMEHFGLPCHSKESVRLFVGNGAEDLMARSVPGGRDHPQFAQILDYYRPYYTAHAADQTHPYDGILPLLRTLKERGIAVGIASNKHDAAVKALAQRYFPGLVDVAVGEGGRIRKKPCPDSVEEAMHSVGASREEVVYVGDSDVDVWTGDEAGVFTVSVLWGFRDADCLAAAGAKQYAKTPAELLNYIEM